MTTNTKPAGQVKRLVLDIDGSKYVLDPSVTKEEALSIVDILSKGARTCGTIYSDGSYSDHCYTERDVDVCLRVTSAEIHESRAAAQAAADAASAAAAAKEVAK